MTTQHPTVSNERNATIEATHEVRDACLCLHVHRAARTLSRSFDDAFRPLGLTSGQFSVLNALNQSAPPTMQQVASLLSMDRTTLTAALKPLVRDGLVETAAMKGDRRRKQVALTTAGRRRLAEAIALWRLAHGEVEARLPKTDIERLRENLRAISTQ